MSKVSATSAFYMLRNKEIRYFLVARRFSFEIFTFHKLKWTDERAFLATKQNPTKCPFVSGSNVDVALHNVVREPSRSLSFYLYQGSKPRLVRFFSKSNLLRQVNSLPSLLPFSPSFLSSLSFCLFRVFFISSSPERVHENESKSVVRVHMRRNIRSSARPG